MDKVQLDQVAKEWSGQTVKKLTVILAGDQTISAVLKTPEIWCQVQTSDSDKVLCLRDEVELVSRDGLSFTVGVRVLQTRHDGRVYLSQPLRTENLADSGLYADGTYETVRIGSRFGVRNVKTRRIETEYRTARAAEMDIRQRVIMSAAA